MPKRIKNRGGYTRAYHERERLYSALNLLSMGDLHDTKRNRLIIAMIRVAAENPVFKRKS